ncbi:hypothetical protein ACHWWK_01175 [Klebsiella pneumoniae]
MYLLEKLAARGVDYLHFSVGATHRPSIVDTSDPTPLIEKYCAMRSDTLAQVPVMGVGGVVNAADAEQGLDHGYDLIAVGRACIAYRTGRHVSPPAKSWSCLSTAPSVKRCTFRNRYGVSRWWKR